MEHLPTEILSDIFLQCLDKEECNCRPQLVATICLRWRQIALSTPLLWRHIRIDCEADSHDTESLYSLLTLQLERSCAVPLTVQFSYSDEEDLSIFQLLLTSSQRWESLDVELNMSQYRQIQTSACEFSNLKHLTVRHAPSLQLGNLSQPLPMLSELALIWLVSPLPKKLPWTNISKCVLSNSSSVEAINIISTTPTLVELSLSGCYCLIEGGSHVPSMPVFTTSTLHTLSITRCSRDFARDFLGHLCATSLCRFTLDTLDNASPSNASMLSGLLTTAKGITHLALHRVRLTETELIALMPLMDSVERLEISWPSDVHTRAVIGALTYTPLERTNWLPRMRYLTLTGGLSCPDAELLRMLQSRSPRGPSGSGATLKRVELFYAGRTFFFDRALDGLRGLTTKEKETRSPGINGAVGMEIVVSFEGPPGTGPFAGEEEDGEVVPLGDYS
ncbi:hypothetical protein C8F01DRAFT_1120856 [Mycena amicta]|nr:hypothetical protein C8F01DRAFT_1120856 [Mycena amicta]